ncbi:MAG: hypothetical protein WC829_04760 [Hyphomicrobium sp.]|jgi:hypothetical protein
MRGHRLSFSECNQARVWRAAVSRISPRVVVTACLVAATALLLASTPAPAQDTEMVEGGDAFSMSESPERGMPASNARVKPLLASRPNEFVTICVAGCGQAVIVQALPMPREKHLGSMRTTAGGADQESSRAAYDSKDPNAVLCVAGCGGRSGQVVQQMQGLPPVKLHRPVHEGNEPLDIH